LKTNTKSRRELEIDYWVKDNADFIKRVKSIERILLLIELFVGGLVLLFVIYLVNHYV
jgi:hypothetical protein